MAHTHFLSYRHLLGLCLVFIFTKAGSQNQYVPAGADPTPYKLLKQGNKVVFDVQDENADEAICLYREALEISLASGKDPKAISRSYYRIGSAYDYLMQLEAAAYYFNKGYEVALAANDSIELGVSCFALHVLYNKYNITQTPSLKNAEKAMDWLTKAINYNPEHTAAYEEIKYLIVLAEFYMGRFGYLKDTQKADSILNIIPDQIATSKRLLPEDMYQLQKKYSTANAYFLSTNQKLYEGLKVINKAIENTRPYDYAGLRGHYVVKLAILTQLGQYKEALEAHLKFNEYNELLSSKEHREKAMELEAVYKNERSQKKIDKQQAEIRKQRIVMFSSLAGIFSVLVLLLFLWRSRKKINIQRKKLRALNELLQERNQFLYSQKKEMEQFDDFKNKVFSVVAHDLRSPVNALQGVVNLYETNLIQDDDHLLQKVMTEVKARVQQTDNLITNLLFWAGSQMQGFTLNKKQIYLPGVLKEVISLYADKSKAKDIAVTTQVSEACTYVETDPEIIKMLLRNFINNAIKFTATGGSIKVQAARNKNDLMLSVTDKGTGMTKETLEAIKEGKKTTYRGTDGEPGSGIGLSLCYNICERIGGHINITSQPQRGTIIQAFLPVFNA